MLENTSAVKSIVPNVFKWEHLKEENVQEKKESQRLVEIFQAPVS